MFHSQTNHSFINYHQPQTSLHQDLGLNSFISADLKIADQSATTNIPSCQQIDSPQIYPFMKSQQSKQVKRLKQRIGSLKEQQKMMDKKFEGCIKRLQSRLSSKQQLNIKMKGEVSALKSDCIETLKDIEIIKRHLKKQKCQTQDKQKAQKGKYFCSKVAYSEVNMKKKTSCLTNFSRK